MELVKPLFGLALFFGAGLLYFLPALIGSRRDHSQKYLILLVNLFLGWTILGWLFCLYVVAFKPEPASK